MRIGVPKEIKNHEYRVGLTPAAVRELKRDGHRLLVQAHAGSAIGFSDDDYRAAGADILGSAAEVYAEAELIVKVKEPQPEEIPLLRANHILFTYLHLAPAPELTQALLAAKVIGIAYETVTDAQGSLPLLAPMSEVAGRLSIQAAAHALEKAQGGSGVLLGGVPGVLPANVLIIGGGVVGTQAARMAVGLGADVTLIDRSLPRLKLLDEQFNGRLKTLYSTADAIERELVNADVVIGAVLIPGAAAPKLVTRAMLKRMKPGSVMVDVAIDQGGCFESSRPTSHQHPTYVEDGVIHYCVTNMPGAVARTATLALTQATLPYVLSLANLGWQQALQQNPNFCAGLNVCHGSVTHPAVAQSLGLAYSDSAQFFVR